MAENTDISWAQATHNQWIGCQETGSPACTGCYARELMSVRYKRVDWGPHAERIPTSEGNQRKPLAWNRNPTKLNPPPGEKPFVFGGSLMDFADNKAPAGEPEKLFATIRATPNLQWLMLTKRIGNVIDLAERVGGWPPNAALMITAVTQAEADRDIPKLIAAAAALRPTFTGLSMEPLAERVVIDRWLGQIGWVIVGGGTDQGRHKAYDSDPSWFREILLACTVANVPFHMKQMTRNATIPADLQVQQRPRVAA